MERKEFRLNGEPRKNLANWLVDQFPNLKEEYSKRTIPEPLVERIHEVHEAVITVLELTINSGNSWLRKYYSDDLERLKLCYGVRDLQGYTSNLLELLKAIKEEDK